MMDSLCEIKLQTLTGEAFADHGEVIEISDANNRFEINCGRTVRHHALAHVDVADNGGKAIISLFRSSPITLPFQLKAMERHPLGSQSFIPVGCNPYIVVVAGKGDFHTDNIRAFLVRSGQGVHYHKGVWHHYNLVLGGLGDFVVVDRDGAGNNCDEVAIPPDIKVVINN